MSWQPTIIDGLRQGVRLILTRDSEVMQIALRSLETAAAATGWRLSLGCR